MEVGAMSRPGPRTPGDQPMTAAKPEESCWRMKGNGAALLNWGTPSREFVFFKSPCVEEAACSQECLEVCVSWPLILGSSLCWQPTPCCLAFSETLLCRLQAVWSLSPWILPIGVFFLSSRASSDCLSLLFLSLQHGLSVSPLLSLFLLTPHSWILTPSSVSFLSCPPVSSCVPLLSLLPSCSVLLPAS